MEQKPLVLFDFDGVLIDTLLISYDITKEINKEITLDEYKSLFNGNIHDAMHTEIGSGKQFHPHDVFIEKYSARSREIKIPHELVNLVSALKEKADLAVVSSTPSSFIDEIVSRDGLRGVFRDILGSDVHTSKVVKINSLLEKYSVPPGKTLFITDTVGDIKEGRECGVPSVGVSWGFHDRAHLEKAQPFAVVDTPEELAAAIARFFSGTI